MKINSLIIYFILFCFLSCNKKAQLQQKQRINFTADEVLINIRDFGAIPNDSKDDSEAIQKAIDFAIKNKNSSKVYCPPGIYDLEKGVVIANKKNNGEYFFVTMTISGHIPVYSSNQSIGSSTVFKLKNPTFGIALTKARNCLIENIVFEGCTRYTANIKNILSWKNEDWGIKSNARIDQFSPSCAIAIDPFHKNIPSTSRYTKFDNYYSNSSKAGSSMILIKGCSFIKHYIAISNNSSGTVQNGDNIRVEQCHVTVCHTFWSAGQTQSRANSINNVYATFLNTFVSGVQIGAQQGTPPFITNVNIAGFCKKLADLKSGFSGFWIQQSYLESIWSLGVALVNTIHFDQCQIKFNTLEEVKDYPSAHLLSNSTCTFTSCSLEFFSNCTIPTPFIFKAPIVIINGGHIEGGIIAADGITNSGGEKLHNVTYNNVFIKCLGKYIDGSNTQKDLSNLKDNILIGGDKAISTDGSVFENPGSTYNIEYFESAIIEKDNKGYYFIKTKYPNKYLPGDNLFSLSEINHADIGRPEYSTRASLGYVETVLGNQIKLSNVPSQLKEGKHEIYIVYYPIFYPFIWGNVEQNSNIISDVQALGQSYIPKKKTRIISFDILPSGTYIENYDYEKKKIYLNNGALKSQKEALLYNADYTQEIRVKGNSFHRIQGFIKGAKIYNMETEKFIQYCTKPGLKKESKFKPTIKNIDLGI